MPTDDQILEAVEREILARLTSDPCSECGRGKDASGVAATALAKILNDQKRMKIAEQKNEVEERQEGQLNPLSLVAAVRKLPFDHPKRVEMLELLDGYILSLQEAVKSLRQRIVSSDIL